MVAGKGESKVAEPRGVKQIPLAVGVKQAVAEATQEIRQVKRSGALWMVVGHLAFVLCSKYVLTVPLLVQMMLYSVPLTVVGSYLALNQRVAEVEGGGGASDAVEVISGRAAALFPFLASLVLGSIYLLYKYLPVDIVNLLLGGSILVGGWYATSATIAQLWLLIYPESSPIIAERTIHCPWYLAWLLDQKIHLVVSPSSVIGALLGGIIVFSWLLTKAWLMHNLFAIGCSIHAIRCVRVGSFKTATLLLVGLFFYDVFWVFKTDVMVTVAKKFDAPAKILFPVGNGKFSLLGLGDIVIPGIFVALTLRFDYFRHSMKYKDDCQSTVLPMYRTFSKFYFHASLFACASSLFLTGVVMLLWRTSQPALLYLVPSLLVSVYAPALFRGELGPLLSYNEDEEDEVDDDDDDEPPTADKNQ